MRMSVRARPLYEMATCLANSRWVAKRLYDRAVAALGYVGITDVICLMGFYISVSDDDGDLVLALAQRIAGAEMSSQRPHHLR